VGANEAGKPFDENLSVFRVHRITQRIKLLYVRGIGYRLDPTRMSYGLTKG
jgi:hypothetical protein